MLPKTKWYYQTSIFIFSFLLTLVITSSTFAQKGPGFTAFENGAFEKAAIIFQKNSKNKKTAIEGLLGMAKLASAAAYNKRDLLLAHEYIKECALLYRDLKTKQKKAYKTTLDISYKKITTVRKNIFNDILEIAKSKTDIAYYESLLDKSFNSKEKKAIYHLKDELLLVEAARKNNYAAFHSFIQNNYKNLKRYSPDLLKTAESQAFQCFIQENGWENISQFKQEQPNSFITKDRGLRSFLAIRTKNSPKLFRNFIKEHPQSYFVKVAADALCIDQYYAIKASKNSIKYVEFIETNKLSTLADSMENHLIAIAAERPTIEHFENMIAASPAITKSNKFMNLFYEIYTADSTLTSLESFVIKYPTFYDQKRVEIDTEVFRLRDIEENKKPYAQRLAEKNQQAIIKKAKSHPEEAFTLLQKLIKTNMDKQEWEQALQKVETFQPHFGVYKFYTNLVEILQRPNSNSIPNSLNSNINSTGEEYSPIISSDGNSLFFAAKNRKGSIGGEDIFVSKKIANKWQPATVIDDICSIKHEAPLSISVDGNRLIIFNAGKLAYSNKTATGWSKVTNFSNTINSQSWQCDGMITSDGKHLILASRSYGNIDIMVSEKQKDGSWGILKSLGSTINTDKSERSPFLHPDMKTLYFCSDGHGGLGDLDVFKSTRLDDTWTNWTAPINLGKEINSSERDWDYRISTDGLTAYFASEKEGHDDIFEVALPASMRPQPVKTISGDVVGLEKGKAAKVIVKDAKTGKNIAEATTDPTTGKYYVVIPEGITPTISIVKENVYSSPQEIVMTDKGVVKQDIRVVDFSKEKDLSLAFNDLLFDTNQSDIKPNFMEDLDRLATLVLENNYHITVEGHTDNVGGTDYNQKLSQKRAEAVRKYLISKDCPPSQIVAKGFGATKPIASNESEENRKRNRRVQIYFKKL